ncbi:MAG TPA: universal stress protein [Gaiellaceae bacterium]|nr:universal stress protein [Gaiellaceae bacterium]
MSKRILVVTTASVPREDLHDQVRAHAGSEDADVRVVAPAAEISRLDWLANDEQEARTAAEERAFEAGHAVAPAARSVDAEVGDTDPVQAIEDALREFPADELVLVTHPDEDASWLEEGTPEEAFARFDLRVTHLVVAED